MRTGCDGRLGWALLGSWVLGSWLFGCWLVGSLALGLLGSWLVGSWALGRRNPSSSPGRPPGNSVKWGGSSNQFIVSGWSPLVADTEVRSIESRVLLMAMILPP